MAQLTKYHLPPHKPLFLELLNHPSAWKMKRGEQKWLHTKFSLELPCKQITPLRGCIDLLLLAPWDRSATV